MWGPRHGPCRAAGAPIRTAAPGSPAACPALGRRGRSRVGTHSKGPLRKSSQGEGSGLWFPAESPHPCVRLSPASLSKTPAGPVGARSSTGLKVCQCLLSLIGQICCKAPSLRKSAFTFPLAATQQHHSPAAPVGKCRVFNWCCSFDRCAEREL